MWKAIQADRPHAIKKDTAAKPNLRGARHHASRILRTLDAVAALIIHSGEKDAIVYVMADSGPALCYTLAAVAAGRVCGYRIFLHQPNFSSVNKRSPLQAWVNRIAGNNATHILPSESMARHFSSAYGFVPHRICISNAAFVCPTRTVSPNNNRKALIIGCLIDSNQKNGLFPFLSILRIARLCDLPIRGVLVGRIHSARDRVLLQALQVELGGSLDYRDTIDSDNIHDFFKDIDVFTYSAESSHYTQSIMIVESLAQGVPVIAHDHGGISEQIGGAGFAISTDSDFVQGSLNYLTRYYADPALLAEHQTLARQRFDSERLLGLCQLLSVFDRKTKYA